MKTVTLDQKMVVRPLGHTWGYYPAFDLTNLSRGSGGRSPSELVEQMDGSATRRLRDGYVALLDSGDD